MDNLLNPKMPIYNAAPDAQHRSRLSLSTGTRPAHIANQTLRNVAQETPAKRISIWPRDISAADVKHQVRSNQPTSPWYQFYRKTGQSVDRHAQCSVVYQWMHINLRARLQFSIHEDLNICFYPIDHRKRRYALVHTQIFHQSIRGSKRQSSCSQFLMQRF